MNYRLIKMTFGKYKGKYVWEIADVNYFYWLYKNVKLQGEMLFAVKYKLQIK